MDYTEDDETLAERLASRFALRHSDTAHRLGVKSLELQELAEERHLSVRLARRFAAAHPETARRLQAKVEIYTHRPLTDAWPNHILRAHLGGSYPWDSQDDRRGEELS